MMVSYDVHYNAVAQSRSACSDRPRRHFTDTLLAPKVLLDQDDQSSRQPRWLGAFTPEDRASSSRPAAHAESQLSFELHALPLVSRRPF